MGVRPAAEPDCLLQAYLWRMDGDRRGWWARHWQDIVYDVAPPAILLTLGLLDVYTGMFAAPVGDAPTVTALVPGALACAALLFRRRYPLVVLATILLLVFVPPLLSPTSLTYWDEFAVWLVALYSCARHLRLRWALAGLALSAVGMTALPLEFAELRSAGDLVYNSFLVAAAFGLGLLTRSWASYRHRSIQAAADRAVAEERAGRRERTRIARELHDVISHTITVIVMQAGGARLAGAHDPQVAIDTLARIEVLGTESLTELRALLSVLGDDSTDAVSMTPQPVLADVRELCDRMRSLGLPVRLRADDDLDTAPAGVQLAGYRIVQEAATNILKHAGPVPTEITLRREPDGSLRIEVSSARGSGAAAVTGAGRGVAGMRERAAALGGTFSAGPRPDGGFLVEAVLPAAAPPRVPGSSAMQQPTTEQKA
jgi:signal transduction histidine kinase